MTLGEALRMFSASLPAVLGLPARPWNGRDLTAAEVAGARRAMLRAFALGEGAYFSAQAAHEWLSEHAP